jgi:hypothetical protein
MKTTKKIGIDITEADGTPLTCGNYFYWDAEMSQILMQEAGDFCPDVDFKQKEEGAFETRFHKDADNGVELCGLSRSIEDKRVRIPECDLDKFIAAIDELHKKSERPGIPADNRTFMHDFRVPNPLLMKSAWRVSTGFTQRLLVLWGYDDRNTSASDAVILPLTPTSANWEDAPYRRDLKELLKGHLSRHKFNWGKLFRFLFCSLLAILLLFLLLTVILNIAEHKCCTCQGETSFSLKQFPYVCDKCGKAEKKCSCSEKKPDDTVIEKKPDGTVTEKKPDGTVIEKKPDGTETEKKPDGTVTEKKPDGTVTEKKPDGTVTEKKPDGTVTEKKPDGTETEKKPDGTVTEKKPDGTETEKKPDGTVTEKKPDGTVTEKKPDGSETEKKPDGTVTEKKPDGTETEKKPDGTVTEKKPDGTVTEKKPDGTETEKKPDGTVTEKKPDGTVTEKKPDGTETEKKPDGTVTEKKPDGTVTEKKPDGSETEKKPDGTVTEKKPDGTETEKKPDDTGTEKKPDDSETEKKPDDTGTEKKPDGTETEKKPGGTVTDKKPVDVCPICKSELGKDGKCPNICNKCHQEHLKDGKCPKCDVPAISDFTFIIKMDRKSDKGDSANVVFSVTPDNCMKNVNYIVHSWSINGDLKAQGDKKQFAAELSYKKRYVITAAVTVNGKEQKVLPYQWNSVDSPVWMIARVGNSDSEYQVICTNSSNTNFRIQKWDRPVFMNGKREDISQKIQCTDLIPTGDNKARISWSQQYIGEYIMILGATVNVLPGNGRSSKTEEVKTSFVFINGSMAQALISLKYANAKNRVYHCLARNTDGSQHNGTAFAVTDKLLLTNYHVAVGNIPEYYGGAESTVDQSRTLVLSNEKGMYYARVLKFDRATDMALLRLCDKNGGETDSRLPAHFIVSDAPPAKNARVFSLGYPSGTTRFGEPAFVDGKIEQFVHASKRGGVIFHFSNIKPGYSGGPLIYMDHDATIIGVNTSGVVSDTPVKQGASIATSATEIRRLFPEIFNASR